MSHASPVERLHEEVETIARSDSPKLVVTAISPEGRAHSATTWFAPTPELNLLFTSAPTRIHSRYIEDCIDGYGVAHVSGAMDDSTQKKSQPCHGVSYEGTAHRLHKPEEIQKAVATFLMYETFGAEELDGYLNHTKPEVPAHGIYVIKPKLWTVFDGRLGSDRSDRLVHLDWPQPQQV